jgi:hypothetical protein
LIREVERLIGSVIISQGLITVSERFVYEILVHPSVAVSDPYTTCSGADGTQV